MILKTYIYILKKIYLTHGSTSDPLVELVARLINQVNVRFGFNNHGCMPLFQKYGSFSWLVFQNLCSFVLDMQTPLALNQLSKSVVKIIIESYIYGSHKHSTTTFWCVRPP